MVRGESVYRREGKKAAAITMIDDDSDPSW